MAIEDNESSGSRAVDPSPKLAPKQSRLKLDVYNEVLRRIQEFNYADATLPGFDDQLWLHFDRLPVRYALDVNVERAQDVLAHMRLLDLAQYSAHRFAFEVRPVQVHPSAYGNPIDPSIQEDAQSSFYGKQGVHQPPTFASTPSLEFSALKTNRRIVEDGGSAAHSSSSFSRPMHEITFSTIDKPKVLSQLTAMVAEIGLNIQEAHAFSTVDGFSLDVFVVDGWPYEESEQLRVAVEKILKFKEKSLLKEHSAPAMADLSQSKSHPCFLKIPSDGANVWEIDVGQLRFENKVGSGTYGDLYKGTYCSQEVAIKVLKPDSMNTDMLAEFSQEVYILRKVRHKNVVQFIGACTESPNLCIVTEFMSKGSVHDFLHKQNGEFDLPSLLKVAMDVSKGMNYLHQNNIIHRDLKTANLLMDENDVIKVADFGVARVQAQSGVMTAETGTYRWMAPEVIEHRPYDHKADVFSFGIVLWELLTREVPYASLTPLQAAVGVVQSGLRPAIPKQTHQKMAELLERCWQHDPFLRPNFCEIMDQLQQISKHLS